jgi:anti-sigma B factor antagonist
MVLDSSRPGPDDAIQCPRVPARVRERDRRDSSVNIDLESGLPFRSDARPAFRVAYRRLGESTVVAVGGELDMATAPTLREVLPRAILDAGSTPRLFVDLDAVPFMDSWGFRPITDAVPQLRDLGGDLRVVAARPPVQRLMALLGWEDLIAVRRRD